MHMHTLKIGLVEPVKGFDFEDFSAQLLARLDRLPPLQCRALATPFALNHPLWVSDSPIDPARHVFHHRLPPPGGMAELATLVGEIASTPLHRAIPLWEMHVCEGMND